MVESNTKNSTRYSLTANYFTAWYLSTGIWVVYFLMAGTRNVDGDEGLYLEAARLVSEGKKLYLDFFYQQMPLLPYLYALWMKLFGFTLSSARMFSSLLTALSCFVTLFFIARSTRDLVIVYLSAALLLGNGVLLAWAPVVKTHPLNMFCLTLSALLLLEWKQSSRQSVWMILLAALSIGVGVHSRLTLAPYFFIFLVFIFLNSSHFRLRNCLLFCLLFAFTSIPSLYYFLSDPEKFYQYNFLYHTTIYPGIVGTEHRLEVAVWLLTRANFFILILFAQAGILLTAKEGWKPFIKSNEGFIAVLLLTFVVVHMSAAEPFTQYFSAMVPLLVLAAVPFFQWVLRKLSLLKGVAIVSVLLVYLYFSPHQRTFEIVSMKSDQPLWAVNHMEAVARTVQKIVGPDEYCLTWWPGYAFMAGCRSVRGMENHMRNYAIQKRIPPDVLENYQMMSEERLMSDLSKRKYRLLIDGVYHFESPWSEEIQSLIRENYLLVSKIEGVKLYVPNASVQNPIETERFDGLYGKAKR